MRNPCSCYAEHKIADIAKTALYWNQSEGPVLNSTGLTVLSIHLVSIAPITPILT